MRVPRVLLLAVSAALVAGMSIRAEAVDVPAPVPPQAADSDASKQARQLFDEGQMHYSLGEYDQALTSFRRAYELSAAPGLLFNIAQAHRLKGDCRQALEVYRHFIRLASGSPYRAEAESQVEALSVRCGAEPSVAPGPPQPAPPKVVSTPSLVSRPAEPAPAAAPSRSRSGKRTTVALLAAGVTAGAAAGVVTWWNGSRYNDWSVEDRRLAAPLPAGASVDDWTRRQTANDDLLSSIQRADKIDVALVSLSAVCLVGATLLSAFLNR